MSELEELVRRARESFFVDETALDLVLARRRDGRLTEAEAMRDIRALLEGSALPAESIGMEWNDLMEGMKEESASWQRIAEKQYRHGFWSLPIAALLFLVIVLTASIHFEAPIAIVIPAFSVANAAVGVHSFLIFRLHQQARLAAERLSEKRAASLFLRLALSRAHAEEAPAILSTAAAMFLGHQAPATLPLQAGDYAGVKKGTEV